MCGECALYSLALSTLIYVSLGTFMSMCFANNRITLKQKKNKMFGIRFAYCYRMASVHRWRYCNKHIQLIHLCSRSQNIYSPNPTIFNLQFSISFDFPLFLRCSRVVKSITIFIQLLCNHFSVALFQQELFWYCKYRRKIRVKIRTWFWCCSDLLFQC